MPNSLANDSGFDEFRQIFETECSEGLDVIESGLLALEGNHDSNDAHETINDIFRGAHSIKGGAATFGYTNIAEFTHVMETLLDKLRADELQISAPLVQQFLEAVDCLRDMVETMNGGEYDKVRTEKVQKELEVWLEGGSPDENANVIVPSSEVNVEESKAPAQKLWDIHFEPKRAFLLTGNQPQHLFRALADLGSTTFKVICDDLPAFEDYRPEEMYLAWDITLEADVSVEEILQVFDWVETECTVDVVERQVEVQEEFDRRADDRRANNEGLDRRKQDRRGTKKETGSIRVDIEKIDVLLNLVGEMVINQAMLNQCNAKDENAGNAELDQGLVLLERTTRELQEAVMQIRMLPIGVTFSRFPRLVYDLSAKLNKQVELIITGEQTEVDKTVLEKIGDPLLHLIRNSLDHGLEMPERRLEIEKPEVGVINLSASHEGGSVVIKVIDDGAGLNTEKILNKAIENGLVSENDKLTEPQIHDLIFLPGFSTAEVVSDVSGRGVGMDVVRRNIEDIGGRVEVYSEAGKGSTFKITLPLTLAILDGQLIKVGNETYVLPLLSIVETVSLKKENVNIISGKEIVYRLRGEAIPVIDTRTIYRIPGEKGLDNFENKQLIIVESDRRSIGLVVDDLLDQHQVVIKSIETNFSKVPGMLGATILGDGTVSLIIDVTNIAELLDNDAREPIAH